jgi:hypothetical protein
MPDLFGSQTLVPTHAIETPTLVSFGSSACRTAKHELGDFGLLL